MEVTHEFIATMLGTRRAGVTEMAGKFQRAGLIKYNRGRMHISNRAGLKTFSCECYRIVKKKFARLLA
jgi:Mn-dependent DtxR family transcriptional regulator